MSGMRSLLRPILVGGERRSEFVAIAVYLVVAPSSTVFATLVGSMSEYRYGNQFVKDWRFAEPVSGSRIPF